MSGHYRMYRGWMDNPVFGGKLCRAGAWAWLIENAAWRERRLDIKGKTVILQRGQLSASLRFMADAWGWRRDAVARYLTRLQTETMIATDTATGETIITICNYGIYQSVGQDTATANATANATGAGQHRDSTATAPRQNRKKGRKKEGKKEDTEASASVVESGFDQLWADWQPYKTPKGSKNGALSEWDRHVVKPGVDAAMVTSQAVAYCDECQRTDTNTQHIERWIKKHRWEDERIETSQTGKPARESAADASDRRRAGLTAAVVGVMDGGPGCPGEPPDGGGATGPLGEPVPAGKPEGSGGASRQNAGDLPNAGELARDSGVLPGSAGGRAAGSGREGAQTRPAGMQVVPEAGGTARADPGGTNPAPDAGVPVEGGAATGDIRETSGVETPPGPDMPDIPDFLDQREGSAG